jgi:cytochrome c-type biogenesis protein CcmE
MRNVKFVVPALLGIVVATFFLVQSASGDFEYYRYTSEVDRTQFADGVRFRLAGTVVPGTITETVEASVFQISDGLETVDVRLLNTPPPLFNAEVEVLLEGAFQGDVFVADDAVIRHEAEYEAPPTGTDVEN